MKRSLPLNLLLFLFTFASIGQTIVNTSVEDKKVVLEEFTGIHCVYCPQGHAIAQAIQDNNPGNVFLINIHTGSYAVPGVGEPDFRTPFGAAIAGQSGLIGYPAGTVNRRNFPGQEQGNAGTTAMSRGQWTGASNTVLSEESYVNVGVEAEIDVQTNELIVHVEAYYTGNSPEGTNLLNVALLQNNTKGPQTGGNMGNDYVHMHRLVDMITGQWGIELPTTTSGTFVDETYTFPIPSDYNGIPVELVDLEIVAFVTETHQLIASGSGAYPTFTGITNANDANVRYIEDIETQCGTTITPSVNIQNIGQDEITSLSIEYSVNGGTPEVYDWTGSLTSLQSETIELPEITYTVGDTNIVDVSIPNDDDNTNNSQNYSFDRAVVATNYVNLELHTDNWGSECTWNIKDSSGTTVYNGGPYGNNQTINESFTLPNDCYTFNLIDSYGDGGGAVTLTDDENNVIYSTNGGYGSGASTNFSTDGILAVNDNVLDNISIYPNPATSILNIRNADNSTIEVYDILGKLILTKISTSLEEEINVSSFQTGTYFLKISKDNQTLNKKFIITK